MALTTLPRFDSLYEIAECDLCNKALVRLGAETIKDTTEETKQARYCRALYAETRDELLRIHPFNFATKTAYISDDTDYVHPKMGFTQAFHAEKYTTFTGSAGATTLVSGIPDDLGIETFPGMAVTGTSIADGTRIVSVDLVNRTILLDRATTGAATSFTVHLPMIKLLSVGGTIESPFEVAGSGSTKRIFTDIEAGEYGLEIKYIEQVIDPSLFDSLFVDALILRLASKLAIVLSSSKGLTGALQGEFSSIIQAARYADSEESQVDASEDKWTDRSGTY